MALTLNDDEKLRIRYHLGYPILQQTGALSFGGVVPQQLFFLVEANIANVKPEGIPLVQRLLCNLDEIECLLMQGAKDMRIARTGGGTEINLQYTEKLEREYVRWACRLADALSVAVDPLARRFANAFSGVNVPVVG